VNKLETSLESTQSRNQSKVRWTDSVFSNI